MSTTLDSSTSPVDSRHANDERIQSPPAFLDLADSAARLGGNIQDVAAVRALKRMEHERQRVIQRRIFEDQMRQLEQQQARELLTIPLETSQHLAVSAPTTPPRVNAVLSDDHSPTYPSGLHHVVDADMLSQAVGKADKRKSVTYAPSVNHSPEMPSSNPSFARPGGAKSMPASRRTSASEHDEELAGHLQGLSLAGERAERISTPSGGIPQSILRTNIGRFGNDYAGGYNAGVMLDEQLDQEMHNAIRHLPTSDEDKFSSNGFVGKLRLGRPDRRNVTNPGMGLSGGLGELIINGTGLSQGLSSRRGSPLSLGDTLSSITSARSVPATPLPGMPNSAGQLAKAPGTPLSGDPHNINGILSAQISRQLSEDSELNPSLSRMSSGHMDNSPLSFNSIQGGLDEYGGEGVYGLSGGMEGGYNSYGFEAGGRGAAVGATGSTALYHHNGAKYGFNMNGRPNGADSKMNGLHGPKHKRGDVDREFNRFAGTRLEDLQGEIPQLCKDQHGCRYLQKKLEEGVPEHRDMIFRETFNHFADLMTDPFGNYLCQKLLEFSTDEQRNVICESVAQDLVNISLNMHGTRAVQKMIDFLSTRRQPACVVLIKDLNGNHDNQVFHLQCVAANCVEVATHRHGCCVLQRCIDMHPYGNYVVQYILDLNDNRFSDAVIRQFTGNVCALSVQKFSSNVIEKCIRVAEHSTRKILIGELLNRTRLEKLLRDSYGNYCVQTALDYAEPGQRTLLVEGIRPVLPLIRNTPYGKRIQNKLQREHSDAFGSGGGYHHNPQALVNMALGNQSMGGMNHGPASGRHLSHLQAGALADAYTAQNGLYGLQGGPGLHAAPLHGGLQSHGIDSYVMQGSNQHSPGLTPPHTHSAGAGGFSGMSSM
ncbi:ARM repeat-containing protein [Epithele typhae]|uniref:ARM repeat-containing protein n=1 Tax=Epithele typhae TaxID=378194 RepID=UPI0020075A76|nr:ARM repeat-containing protein [Epithele typhae]KAH9927456.1 ARM repeat-containing protein [Epithele typhae]